jgi:glucose/arabinose dehydrogenase/mono/diheme cytochrome c family protein
LKNNIVLFLLVSLLAIQCSAPDEAQIDIHKGDHIILLGNNLCSRMMNYGYFETELQLRYPDSTLYVRNMCDGGDTPGFRPHSGRNDPWPFAGAKEIQTDLAQASGSIGHLETPDEWLTRHQADVILAFFGYSESFNGPEGLPTFEAELRAFIEHTQSQEYNGETEPRLSLVTPIAFEDLTAKYDFPDGKLENQNLELYTNAIIAIAAEFNVPVVDAFQPSKQWFAASSELTVDGSQLNDAGYQKFAPFLADAVFGENPIVDESNRELVQEAVNEKNWFWHNDYKIPNGVHVFGRRYDPFGPDNYPFELRKIREMTDIRDRAIWQANTGQIMNLVAADRETITLPEVESNYIPGDYGRGLDEYLYGDDAIETIKTPKGYKIELFASEEEFPDLANPVQISFDNKGRLWVAVMPTYPHWKPGDPRPNDKLLILEDTDGDGKADKQTVFADGLHIPVGFEFAPEGVYVSQGTNLKLLKDTDGDDKVDEVEIIMSGFDDHDTHHVISAFCADPSGAIYMGEGVFLHTNVETAYGPVRATNGGFYRFNPQRRRLERTAQLSIPNPWGIAFDDWGQPIFAETSGPAVRWMLPGTVKSRYGVATHKSKDLIKDENKVRPTSGLEFVSSSHFPDEVQGDLLICNSIGFLGMKQHIIRDSETGFETDLRHDLFVSSDKNFRPVDMEFAPDGSLYFLDWHNVLIGHMQHNARDPYRDHVHGRIYRITYPSRPLVKPAKVVAATIPELLENLKLHEYRTRYRTKRELRGRNHREVLSALTSWVEKLDTSDDRYEHHLVEALWVTWGLNNIDRDILDMVLTAEDYKARSAGVRVVRYMGHQLEDQTALLKNAASDDEGRVRLEAIVAASWLDKEDGLEIINEAAQYPLDDWMVHAHKTAEAHLNGVSLNSKEKELKRPGKLDDEEWASYKRGHEIFMRDGYCETCHQENGMGLGASGYPPINGTKWVQGNEERIIKLALKGLHGPITVLNKEYPGQVPMTPYEGLLNDQEMADVLTYVRKSWSNSASVIQPETVKRIREEIKDKKGFYKPEDLLNEYPIGTD